MTDTLIFFAGTFTFYIAHWIISVLLVKLGSYEQAGIFSLAMSTGNIFFGIASYGMRQYQASDIKNSYSDNEYVLSRKITCLTSAVIFLVYLLIMRYPLSYTLVITGYCIFKLIEAYVDVYNGISQRYGQVWVSGVSMAIRGIAVLTVFFATYISAKSLVLLVSLMCLSELICAFLFDNRMARSKGTFSFSFSKKELSNSGKLLLITSSVMLYSFFSNTFSGIPKIVLERLSSSEILGYFSSISSPTAVFNLFVGAITIPLVTKIAKSYQLKDKSRLIKYLLISTASVLSAGLISVVLCLFIGKPVLSFIFNEKILQYYNVIYYVIIAVVFIGFVSIQASFLIALRKLKSALIFSASASILVLVFSLVLIPKYSIYGAAYAMIIASVIQFIAETVYLLKIILSLKSDKAVGCAIVTGCTGSVGVALIEKLVSEGVTVYAVLNPDSDRNSNVPDSEKVKRIFCDISSYSALPSLINEKCDAFFHLAWAGTFGSGRNDAELQNRNIEYALDAVNAAKELGCSVFIGVGSQAEYGRVNEKLSDKTPTNPENEYGKAKLVAGERTRELCRTLGIRHEWIRLLSVFGPFDNKDSLIYSAVSALKNGVSPQYTKGEQIWDLLWSGDAANAIYLTALNGSDGEIYVVGSGEEKPLKEYIEKIHSVVAPDIPPVFGEREYAENQVTYLCANTDKIKGIGFSSETPFEEAIKRMASEIK